MNIELRGRTETRALIYFSRTQDEEIQKMCPQRAKTAEDAIRDFRSSLLPDADSFGRTIYADGVYVGDIWLYCIDENETPDAMLSFCLFEKRLWGRGIMTEAVRLFLSEAQKMFALRTVGAFAFMDNCGSIRVLEKNDFALTECFAEDGRRSAYYEKKLEEIQMKIIDLTHTISENMPVYPGTETPKFDPANTYEKDGFKETRLSMFSHTGTHMDPPAHLFPGRTTLDAFHISQFIGTACVIDCTDVPEGGRITMEHLNRNRANADAAEFLLFFTGWDRFWGHEKYFGEYPCIDDEVADYIIKSKKKGVGLDVIGLDPIADENLTLHKKLLRDNEIVIIENLTCLCAIGRNLFTFCALPLDYENADGAPVRAIAIKE